ncbi:MAG: VanZ family protein [Desulfobacterium sp.]|nr:VanZ family protein [Desulfobacterium sp.]
MWTISSRPCSRISRQGPWKERSFKAMSRLRRTLIYRLPVIAYCGFIFWQSSSASFGSLPTFAFSDKIMHLGGYGLLGVLVFRVLAQESLPLSRKHLILAAIVFSTLFGVSDEIHQGFVAERCADVFDAVADLLGSTLGVLFYAKIKGQQE